MFEPLALGGSRYGNIGALLRMRTFIAKHVRAYMGTGWLDAGLVLSAVAAFSGRWSAR